MRYIQKFKGGDVVHPFIPAKGMAGINIASDQVNDDWENSFEGNWHSKFSPEDIKRMQRKVGVKDDGFWGKESANAYKAMKNANAKEGGLSWGGIWDSIIGTSSSAKPDDRFTRSHEGNWHAELSPEEVKDMQRKIGVKADGFWGGDSVKAYENYLAGNTNRPEVRNSNRDTGGKNTGWNKAVEIAMNGPVDAAISPQTEGFIKYFGNAIMQGLGILGEDESFFSINEGDLNNSEKQAYRDIVYDNLKKNKKGRLDYRDFSSKEDITNSRNSDAALQTFRSKRDGKNLVAPLIFGDEESVREGLSQHTGNSYAYLDKNGNVILVDDYDFNMSQKDPNKKAGASPMDIYNTYKGVQNESGYKNKSGIGAEMYAAHSVGDKIKSSVPVTLNLGPAKSFLTPEQIKQLDVDPNFKHATKEVSIPEIAWNKGKELFGFKEGGIIYKK